ncbi:MAG: ATP-dependent Clp protease adaptor ClpS [Desulfobacterales bacterium]
MSENLPDVKEDAVTDIDEEVTEPPMFKVLLHNDDYTTKEFVVKIIVSVFGKSLEEATQLMWAVHKNGVGVCGVYPFEIAETKVNLVTATARENGFPLRSTMEPE